MRASRNGQLLRDRFHTPPFTVHPVESSRMKSVVGIFASSRKGYFLAEIFVLTVGKVSETEGPFGRAYRKLSARVQLSGSGELRCREICSPRFEEVKVVDELVCVRCIRG